MRSVATIDESLLTQLRYRCIGPTRGGRVVAVAADPNEQSVFYFGAVAGGVWKSDDAGQFWENISDGQMTTSSIGALAVAPSDPNVIWAGTGESTIRIDVSHGDGVYKSTDGGTTWHHMGLEESRHIGALRIHPENPDIVYVAALGHASKDNAERGVYRTIDGGLTWELVLHVSESAGAVDLALDVTNPRIMFATTWEARRTFWSMNSGGPGSGLWRSVDGGDTWENISTNKGLPEGTLGKIGVAVSPAKPDRVWALVEAEDRARGLYRSDDRGNTFKKVSSKGDLYWRPWYYMHIIAHPTDADTVFVMNREAWMSVDGGKEFEEFHTPHGDNHALWIDPANPERMIGADDGGAWVSLNAGRSWSSIYNQLTAQFYHVAVDDQYPYLVYGSQQDNSSIAVPSRTGKGAINWADCYAPGTAESGYVAPKPDDHNVVFVGAIGSSPGGGDSLQRYDHITKQIQLVSVWPEDAHDGNSADVRFAWTYPIMFSPHDTGTLYASGNKVFRSRDEGHSWDTISPDLTYADPETMSTSGPLTTDTAGAEMYATIFSLMVSAHRKGSLMAGSDDGRVHVTSDDGGEWTEVTPSDLPKFSMVTMLAESPHHDATVYMTVARHKMGDYEPYVYKTADFGKSWQRIDDGLPRHEFCRVIREDPERSGLLYVGTELGIHASFDDGASWQSIQSNLPVTPIYDFVVKDNDLVIATHGRSFWILDDLTQLHQLHDDITAGQAHLLRPADTVRTPPHIFAAWGAGKPDGKNYHVTIGQNATFMVDELETGHRVRHMIDAGDDIPFGVRFQYNLPDDHNGELSLAIADASGQEVVSFGQLPSEEDREKPPQLYLSAEPGMNEFQWPMRYPHGPAMVDTEMHKPSAGPLAVPGTYTATLTAGDWSMSQDFELLKDPRVTTSDADLQEQFELLRSIQAKLDEMVVAINDCRSIKGQLSGWQKRLNNNGNGEHGELCGRLDALADQITEIEGELVQIELKSPGDSLNRRLMIFEKLTNLEMIVSSADAKPTVQSTEVFAKLAGQADEQLGRLATVRDGDLAAVNESLAGLDMGIVGA